MRRMTTGLCIAALLSAASAAARSLPKTDHVPEPSACPEMGEGFVRLAGSGTCVKVDGLVRVEVMRQGGGSAATPGNR